MAQAAPDDEGWKHGGWLGGQGIPAPSGPHAVGCVDVMHLFEGETLGLLARLFYPTDRDSAARYPYADFCPDMMYYKGYFGFKKIYRPVSTVLGRLFSSLGQFKTPALYGAPFIDGLRPRPSQLPASNASGTGDGIPLSEFKPRGEEEEEEDKSEEERENGVAAGGSSGPESHPVVVFSHGLGAMRTTYSAICSDLASHGYVVASVEHRDHSACVSLRRVPVLGTHGQQYEDAWLEYYHLSPGENEFPVRHRQVLQRSRDVRKALDLLALLNEGTEFQNLMGNGFDFSQFKGKLCLEKAALMGHSFGGATTIMGMTEDLRFKCGIALDCWMLPIHRDLYDRGVSQPLLFINSYEFQWEENVRSMMKLTKPPDENGHSTCQILTIRGTNHYNQTDIPFLFPTFVLSLLKMQSEINQTAAHYLNQELCSLFLRRYLLRDPDMQGSVPNLDGCAPGHSISLIFGTNLHIGSVANDDNDDDVSNNVEHEDGTSSSMQTPPTAATVDPDPSQA